MHTKLALIPVIGDTGTHVELLQQRLNQLGTTPLNPDGDFGNKTRQAIAAFQLLKGLTATGVVDETLLRKLNLELETGVGANFISDLINIVDRSRISRTDWTNGNRGRAPYGYYYGMALMFARLYARLLDGDRVAEELAKPLAAAGDSLGKCHAAFVAAGLRDFATKPDRLRNLFVLMFGLGLMESSGRYCCGWDRGKLTGWGNPDKKIQPTATNSEAGLFQTSLDILQSVAPNTREMLRTIFAQYRANPDGFREHFSRGGRCSEADAENYGEGEGQMFQAVSKKCPGFAVEFTAVALRNVSNHWNPVINIGHTDKGLQIEPACDQLLREVQAYVDRYLIDGAPAGTEPEASPAPDPAATIAGAEERRATALRLADQVGQKAQLERLFAFRPESVANYWGIVDFNKPSSEKRFFVFDLSTGQMTAYLVAHGKKSGALHAKQFSNVVGSNQSSLGIYKTGTTYRGKHGESLYLDGQESSNSNVRKRYIVIHKADYVVPDYEGAGRAGRSDGCLAVHPGVIEEVIAHLRDGSYILAWHA